MRNMVFATTILLLSVTPSFAAEKPLQADRVLAVAKSQASKENKAVFLIFGASWCEDCHRLDAFLAAPEIRAIFDNHFVITRITVAEEDGGNPALNNPGGESLLIKFGGVAAGGVANLPFISILNDKGKLIVSSNPPAKGNWPAGGIGFPTKPEEINWFVAMLKKGSPTLTTEDAHTIKVWLSKAAASDSQ